MKYLSVAIIVDDKFPSGSGVSRSVQTQIEELTRLGHMVTLIVPISDNIIPKNARVITVPSFRLPGMPKHTRILCASRRTLHEIGGKYRFDVVHSQTDTGALLLASKLAHPSYPYISYQHSRSAYRPDFDFLCKSWLSFVGSQYCSHSHALSTEIFC